ncbi:MAG TPA: MFS transporter [Dongiaceae bacterium]|nr:MFS transporter [Dongiaceae bacterium]
MNPRSPAAAQPTANGRLPIQIYALTVAAFAIGTTEFVIMGLLPDIARDLAVTIPAAGMLVTGYALGVVIGAPIFTLGTSAVPRKVLLIGLMSLFIAGNFIAAIAPSYTILLIARVVSALCHGTFFGVGAVVAAGLVPANRQAGAIALMFMGLAIANIMGVPAGTAIGHAWGWRATFWCVTGLGLVTVIAIAVLVHPVREGGPSHFRTELRSIARLDVWIALATTVAYSASLFAVVTYIAPILLDVTGFTPRQVTIGLFVFGAGLVVGSNLGGRLADIALMPAQISILAALTLVTLVFTWTMGAAMPAYATLFVWGAVSFANISPLQTRVVTTAKGAPTLASSLNIAAFNLGNAGGAALGGLLIHDGFGYPALTIAGAAVAGAGMLLAIWGAARDKNAVAVGTA